MYCSSIWKGRNFRGGVSDWDWESVYRNAIRLGLRPDEFWELTCLEYKLIHEAYIEKRKDDFYYDARLAYYTGCFAQASKPHKLYREILDSVNDEPQSSLDIFGFLKGLGHAPISTGFRIPLDLKTRFDINIFSYILYIDKDIEIVLPDIALSIDGIVQKSIKDKYYIPCKNSILKIKYNTQVYIIMVIRR